MTFEQWYSKLIENHVWAGPAQMHHRPETFKSLCNKVYMDYLAGNGVKSMEDCRRHVYNLVCKTPGDNKKVEWWKPKEESKEVKEEWVPVTGEERAKRLKEWEAIVKGSTMLSSVPKPSYKELAEEGGVLPPKPAPYPTTTMAELYIKKRHIEYIKENYEPRTGKPLPGWIEENEWNVIYDEVNLTKNNL